MKKYHVIVLLALGMVGFFALSLITGSEAMKNVNLREQLKNLRVTQTHAPALADRLSLKDKEINLLSLALPKKEALVLVAKFIETLAQEKEVIATVHFESEELSEDQHGSDVIPVSITVEGTHVGVLGFLEGLASGRYFFVFESVSGKSPDGLRKVNTLTLRGKLYAAKD